MMLLIILLNVAIATWNSFAVGVTWKDTMTLGTKFEKIVLYSAMIQSAIGFSIPLLLGVGYGLVYYFTTGDTPQLTHEEGKQILEGIYSLWYIGIIIPALGSGLAIWIHSLKEAYKRRDFTSIATAGWNTFAQIHNTLGAINHLGGAIGKVSNIFENVLKGDNKNIFIFMVAAVVFSIIGGVMITIWLIKYFAKKSSSRIEEYAEYVKQ